MKAELAELLNRRGVIRRRDHRHLAGAIDWAKASGQVAAILPGIYAAADQAATFRARVLAVCLADPDAILFGAAAARLHDRDAREPTVIDVASGRLHGRAWLRVSQRRIPPELVARTGPIALTNPALTAVDLAVATEGSSLDDALRRGASLGVLHDAAARLVRRPGIIEARRLLRDAKDEPWSWAERQAHGFLRTAGLKGWRANRAITSEGRILGRADISFDAVPLDIEIDGDRWHLAPDQVLRDRIRDRGLNRCGWTVVRFGANEITKDPRAFVEAVRELLSAHRLRGRRLANPAA